MVYDSKAIGEIGLDLQNKLSEFSSKDLEKIAKIATGKMNKQEITALLCDGRYFEAGEILSYIEKMERTPLKLYQLLDEPKDENEMREPVASNLRGKKYTVAYEVPLPKKGRSRARKIDVAGYRKPFLGEVSVIGVELKCQQGRAAIDGAFSQAKDYFEFCEQAMVCFSPHVYLKYADAIKDKGKKNKKLGVWIVSRREVLKIIQDGVTTFVDDEKQKEMAEYIMTGRK